MPASTDRSPTEEFLPGIQYLRGIAASLVVLAHASLMMRYSKFFGESPTAITKAGLFGVAVFFVISGLIITLVALDSHYSASTSRSEFLMRRFVRIIPFTLVCILGYNAVAYLGSGSMDWGGMIRAAVLWPVGSLKPNVIWSLRHELFFYLIFAAAMLGSVRFFWLLPIWLLAPIVATPILGVPEIDIGSYPGSWSELVSVVFVGGETGANLQFAAGMGLAILWRRRRSFFDRMTPSPWVAPILLLGSVAAITTMIELSSLADGLGKQLVWTGAASVVVIAGFLVVSGAGVLHQFLLSLGNASFAIYLTHNPVLLVMFETTSRFRGVLPDFTFWIAYVCIVLAIGYLAHRLVEVPVITFSRKVFLSRRQSAS
jgi:exopolysaccharide production protein ExoZ